MSVPTPPAHPLKVLVIDDNPADRTFLVHLIQQVRHSSCVILEAETGAEGLNLCHTETPQCVFLDFQLPDIDGLEFLQELRQHHGEGEIPVIMVTSRGSENLAVQALKTGAQDYMVKANLSPEALERALANALGKASLILRIEAHRLELERSNQELEQFAYIASHDLQEPLRMVSSYLQLLERRYKDRLDKNAQEFIWFAVDGATRMQRLINDLLAFSRVGTRGKEPVPVDCDAVLDKVLTDLSVVMGESGATIQRNPLPTILADETQLGQLFRNLIGNALKFRGTSSPVISISAHKIEPGLPVYEEPREDNRVEYQFSFVDNGIGFDQKFADRIFLIFQRLHNQEEYQGTGIGLAVCKRIVERHGGTIWAESSPGHGAEFMFTFRGG